MTAYPQPLDLYTLFVNYFAGSMEIFFFCALLFFGYYALKLKMNQFLFIALMGVFILLMANWYNGLYALLIIGIALLVYNIISKIIKT